VTARDTFPNKPFATLSFQIMGDMTQ